MESRNKSSAELSALVPLQLVDSNNFDLVDGSLSEEKILDWGVFHVEHLYSRPGVVSKSAKTTKLCT